MVDKKTMQYHMKRTQERAQTMDDGQIQKWITYYQDLKKFMFLGLPEVMLYIEIYATEMAKRKRKRKMPPTPHLDKLFAE